MFFLSFLFMVIPIGVLLVLGLWSIVTLVRGVKTPRNLRGAPRCGVCSYEVGELAQKRCSECGQLYTVAGVRTAYSALKDRGSYAGVVLSWTSLSLILAVIATIVVNMIEMSRYSTMGNEFTYTGQVTLTPHREMVPLPVYELDIAVDLTHDNMAGMSNVNGQWVTLVNGSVVVTLTPDGGELVSETFDDIGPETDFDKEYVYALYSRAGIELANETLLHEADQVVSVLEMLRDQPDQLEWNISPAGGPAMTQGQFMPGANQLGDPSKPMQYAMHEDGIPIGGLELDSYNIINSQMNFTPPDIEPWWLVMLWSVFGGLALLWIGGTVFFVLRRRRLLSLRPVDDTEASGW